MTGRVLRLLRFERTVANLTEATHYYCDGLGFTLDQSEKYDCLQHLYGERKMQTARLNLGQQSLWLTAFEPSGLPYPSDHTAADLWFQHFALVTRDMRAAYTKLRRHSEEAISRNGPVTLPPSTGNVTAYKFRDPDEHPLELIDFPGNPYWQKYPSAEPVIGIDHSAISVANAQRSIDFYGDKLGFTVAAEGLNSGNEQESLDDLAHDKVGIIALMPQDQATPHIEFLAYQNPVGRTGVFLAAWDIAADRIVMQVDDMAAFIGRLADWPYRLVDLNSGRQGALLHDPDGHLLVFIG